MYIKNLFLILLIGLGGGTCFAQTAQESFGKNRVQYETFKWQYLSSDNFDAYYYGKNEQLARLALKYADDHYVRMSNLVGFKPQGKIKMLVYASVQDQHESNIGLQEQEVMAGGHTDFVKSKVEIAFKGTQTEFRKDIIYGVAKTILNTMLYGGTLKDVVQSSYFLSLPEWYIKGAAKYLSEGWNRELDNYVRNLILVGDLSDPSTLTGKKAEIIGQSIWNYIVVKYGVNEFGGILNYTRIVRNEEAAFEASSGLVYQPLISEWKEFYTSSAKELRLDYWFPDRETLIRKTANADTDYGDVRFSMDGKYLAYFKKYKGRYKVIIEKTEDREKVKKIAGGERVFSYMLNSHYPILAWKSAEELSIVDYNGNKLQLLTVHVNKKQKSRIDIPGLVAVNDISYSENGQSLLISGSRGIFSDIFVFRNGKLEQLTNDPADDITPGFFGTENKIVFSSNRAPDSTGRREENGFYSYTLFTLDPKLKKYTKLSAGGNNWRPVYQNGTLYFLSDRKGITNIFRMSSLDSEPEQVSRFIFDIEEFDISNSDSTLSFIMLRDFTEAVYLQKSFDLSATYNTSQTPREKILNERIREQLEKEKQRQESESLKDTTSSSDLIDINNYVFDTEVRKRKTSISEQDRNALLGYSLPGLPEVNILGPYRYPNLFSVETVISSLKVDPLRGLGIYLEAGMADLLGNHRINAGIFGLTDLRSSNIFGEYSYLKKRVDLKLRYERQSLAAANNVTAEKYALNRFESTFSYPLNVVERLSITPFVLTTKYTPLFLGSFLPDSVTPYIGSREEYVFDNTIIKGMNMIQGTRAKVSLEHYFSPGNPSKNFGRLGVDVRNYLPVHKELTLATRASYGQFFGNDKKYFLLGGMDNWLFNQTEIAGEGDPLYLMPQMDNSDILLNRFVTSMRGFNYNSQYGNKYFLLNAELRWPVVRYLYKGIVVSNFLRNLQLIAFSDIGSAWSGSNPFTRSNSLNTQNLQNGNSPFSATVINYRNPYLIGYGFGARTMFLGYYLKADVAWGVLDGTILDRKYYLTFGFDF